MVVSSSSAVPSARRAWPKNVADQLAIEPDRVVDVAKMRQPAELAQPVDLSRRAAEQRRYLVDAEGRTSRIVLAAWHILGT